MPQTWKQGIITYIYKAKERNMLKNYRPITLLNMVYKIRAIILSNRLTPILNLLTSESQTEYKNSRSTLGVLSLLQKNIKNDNATGLILMDLSKAIDAIDRNLLWAILYEKGPPWDCIRLIRMGHTNNQLRPNYKGALGNSTHNNRGVFQGSPLRAMLFITYFDSMMRGYTQNLHGKIKHRKQTLLQRTPEQEYAWANYL